VFGQACGSEQAIQLISACCSKITEDEAVVSVNEKKW
jgi:hypothetical protein